MRIKQPGLLLFPILLCSILATTTEAQKGFHIEAFVSPGASMGGRYDVYKNYLASVTDTGWNKLGKLITFGIEAGGGIGYNFTEQAGISLGVCYARQGQMYNTYVEYGGPSSPKTTFNRKVELHYLKFPLQFNYVVHPDKPVSFMVTAGFYVGFLQGYEDSDTYEYINKPTKTFIAKGNSYTYTNGGKEIKADFIDGNPYEETDYGGIIGLGLQIRLARLLTMPLMLKYQYGFSDIKNTGCKFKWPDSDSEILFWQQGREDNPNYTLPYHNSSLEISIGLKISFH